MFRLKSDDGEAHDDISTLLKKIRGAHTPEDKSTGLAPPPEKKPGPGEPEPGETGDFSALIQKLGMNNTGNASGAEPEKIEAPDNAPTGGTPTEDEDNGDFDDLLEDVPDAEPVSQDQGLTGDDVPNVPGTFLAQSEAAPAPATPPDEKSVPPAFEPQPEPAIEIIDEDPRDRRTSSIFRKKRAIPKEEVPKKSTGTDESDSDERIISADQISEFSGLILPKGATFQIDEIRLHHGRVNAFENTGTGSLPPELADIWKRDFSTAGFKDLESEFALEKEKISPARQRRAGLQHFSVPYVQQP